MGREFFFWGPRRRRDQLTADFEYSTTWNPDDGAGATKRIRSILSWGLVVALVGMVYAAAGSVVWSAYDHLGRYGVATAPPLITVDSQTFKTLPAGSAEHVRADLEDMRQQVGATVSARADQLTKRVDIAPSTPRMAIKLAAAHQLSARAAPAGPQEPLQPMVARIAPTRSHDLSATSKVPEAPAEVNAPSSIGAALTPLKPSFKPARAVAIELATLRPPRPAFKPNQQVAVVATSAPRIEPVSSPLDYVRNFFDRIVAAIEAGEGANDRGFFVASRDEERSDRSGGSNEAGESGGSVSGGGDRNDRGNGESGGVSGDGDRNDRGNGRSGGGNRGGGGGNGNGRGGGDDDDDDDDD